MDFLSGKKTYIVAFLMALIGVVNALTGDASGWQAVVDQLPTILTGLGLGALRAGVAKGN